MHDLLGLRYLASLRLAMSIYSQCSDLGFAFAMVTGFNNCLMFLNEITKTYKADYVYVLPCSLLRSNCYRLISLSYCIVNLSDILVLNEHWRLACQQAF